MEIDVPQQKLETVQDYLRTYKRICGHIICFSLGYATSSCAARILMDAKEGREAGQFELGKKTQTGATAIIREGRLLGSGGIAVASQTGSPSYFLEADFGGVRGCTSTNRALHDHVESIGLPLKALPTPSRNRDPHPLWEGLFPTSMQQPR